jgi:hypothetical protein
MSEPSRPSAVLPRWLAYVLIFGLYLTLRGYHSRDGDQAYRLPLLLHRQDPGLFRDDPFVRAFDTFNPHAGSLTLLDWASRPLGLSAALFGLFAATFLATVWGVDRLARALWPEAGPRAGWVAVGLVLAAKAGNVGTNHLFEAMLLDRLMAYGFAWVAFAVAVARPKQGLAIAPALLGLAALVHPSLGLQLGMVLAASWVVWFGIGESGGYRPRALIAGLVALGAALLPGLLLNVGQGARLTEGLPEHDFWALSVELQGPQHMLPHLWRLPQWLAWACYPALAVLAWNGRDRGSAGEPAQRRLLSMLAVTLVGLGVAWFAVEVVRDLRVTLFQPFRMATLARGLALVLLSGRALALWGTGRPIDRARVALLVVGLTGDWSLVVATLFDLAVALTDGLSYRVSPRERSFGSRPLPRWTTPESFPRVAALAWRRHGAYVLGGLVLLGGLRFLSRHDTESGHLPLLIALGLVPLARFLPALSWNRRRLAFALGVSWAVPAAALVLAPRVAEGRASAWQESLVERCRFRAAPVDDVERLAVWCRAHTPPGAVFVGPPGPKTFRLWSLRAVAFNRAASPYHAAALCEWFRRFQDHVDDHSPAAEFVRAYQTDRHGLEQRYQAMGDARRAALARRERADYVIAAPPRDSADAEGPLELLHVEGRYAVYRVRPEAATVTASAGTG